MQTLLITLILLTILCKETLSQNNPICKAKRFQCTNETISEEDVCIKIIDEQEKYYMLKPCTSKDKPYCPFGKAKYGTPAVCEAAVETVELKLPSDTCSEHVQCISNNCVNKKCKGQEIDETCKKHEDCDISLYCSVAGVCKLQREFDESCTNDFECVNNCVCNLKKCAFYYTFDNGIQSDNVRACASGYINKGGLCEKGLRSKYPGSPCTYDIDCQYIDSKGKIAKNGKCLCGINSGSYSYCPLETGDSQFASMTRALKFVTARNADCHTVRRFGPCKSLYTEEYNDYHFKLQRFMGYPTLIGNDKCVKQIYTWEFWKFKEGSSIFKATLASFILLGVISYNQFTF